MLEKRTAFLVSQWIAVSQSIKSDLVEYYGLPSGRIEVIPNGVDLRDLQPATQRSDMLRALSLPPEVVLIIAAGRMTEQKGHRYLLAAIAQIYSDFPTLHCVLAGDGPLRGTLENEARSLGISERVHFAGFRSDVPDLLAAADLYVLCSISEGMPIGLLEAMALGRAVVASAVNGVTEVVRHQVDGLLVPPADPGSLSQAIRELLTNLSLRRRLAEAGRERVAQDFTAEKMALRVADLYRARLAETHLTASAPGI
jgi:glycosyltransferase involved in cell wall biosynthesis